MKNHFLPEFYLSRWVLNNQLIEYRCRRNGNIEGKPISPGGTGYQIDLYKNINKDGPDAHIFETSFLKQHDTSAERALKKFENNIQLNDKEAYDWISFLIALQLRHPNDIAALRPLYKQRWEAEIVGLSYDIETFINQKLPAIQEEGMFEMLGKLMQHPSIGQIILNFEHLAFTIKSEVSLITSDRPILMTGTLREDDAYIILPIGPKKLYMCGKTQNTIHRILNKADDEIAEIVNDQIARHATIAVYSSEKGLDGYVEERLGTRNYDSLFMRLGRVSQKENS